MLNEPTMAKSVYQNGPHRNRLQMMMQPSQRKAS